MPPQATIFVGFEDRSPVFKISTGGRCLPRPRKSPRNPRAFSLILRGLTMSAKSSLPILVAGGGVGGLAAALALARQGFAVRVLEQSAEIGEIGAGIQLGPNAFSAFDALGIGDRTRARAVYTERLMLMDALDEREIASVPVGEAFRARFGNPYAVSHRADVHLSLLEGV